MDYRDLKLLEDDLWEAADHLLANSKLTASECSMPVLGLIFLRDATKRFHALPAVFAVELLSRLSSLRRLCWLLSGVCSLSIRRCACY